MNQYFQRVLDAPLTIDRQRFDVAAGRLVGGRCGGCGTVTWPARPVCPRCASTTIEPMPLPAEGRLLTWSRVWVTVEGIEPPYTLGLVQLGPTQVFGQVQHLPEAVPAELRVTLHLDPERHPPYWFERGDLPPAK